MKKLIVISILFFTNMFLIDAKNIVTNIRLDEGSTFHFNSTKYMEGNFQLKFDINESFKNFKILISNTVLSEYSISFNKKSIGDYNNYSCILPQGTYTIKVESMDQNFYANIVELIYFESKIGFKSQCGAADDRVLSSDPKAARKVNSSGVEGGNCSAQLLSNGLVAMSGHCVATNGVFDLPLSALIEFNVPLSNTDGTFNPSLPQDQYPIIQSSIVFEHYSSSNCGREWSIFQVGKNATTNLTAFEAQSDFYYLTNSSPTTSQNIQIVGYGSDFDQLNRDNVQQIHNGPNNGVETLSNNGIIISYEADTESGNSGSAIQRIGNLDFSYGIHNNGGCGGNGGCSGNDDNSGISFQYDNLEDAINEYYGSNTVHVSKVSNTTSETGTAFRPYDTLSEGQDASTSGSENTVVLMSGIYNEANDYLLTKPMLIISPSGASTIK